eukprot:14723113-Alexandrium_andersonii.AAC.1
MSRSNSSSAKATCNRPSCRGRPQAQKHGAPSCQMASLRDVSPIVASGYLRCASWPDKPHTKEERFRVPSG